MNEYVYDDPAYIQLYQSGLQKVDHTINRVIDQTTDHD